MSAFMAYRVSIPTENAQKILRHLESGQLEFKAGCCELSFDVIGMPQLRHAGRQNTYDYVVNAKGSPRAVEALDSPLLANLLTSGHVVPDPLGGILVDPESYRALAAPGVTSGSLRTIGELTVGAFFTSALDINARHAGRCVQALAREAQNEPLPHRRQSDSAAKPEIVSGG